MKKKFSYKDILYKSKRLTALALIVVFGTGLMVTAGMHDEIPVHDGDVLVDSRAATEQNLPQEGTFAEMRASLDLDRSKLLANLDSTINNSENENEKKNASASRWRKRWLMPTKLKICGTCFRIWRGARYLCKSLQRTWYDRQSADEFRNQTELEQILRTY